MIPEEHMEQFKETVFSSKNIYAIKLDFEYFYESCEQLRKIKKESSVINVPVFVLTGRFELLF